MSEMENMLEAQKEILRDDSFCYHTNIFKDGVYNKILSNGIEEEFYQDLLNHYENGYDFEIIFIDEKSKKEEDKNFVDSKIVAEKLASFSKNNTEEAYLRITEEAFLEGLENTVKSNEDLKKILTEKISKVSNKRLHRPK